MKHLLILLLITSSIDCGAQRLSTQQRTDINSLIAAAVTPVRSVNTTQDKAISLISQRLTADSAADKKRLSILEGSLKNIPAYSNTLQVGGKPLNRDSLIASYVGNIDYLYAQFLLMQKQINKKDSVITDLQRQVNDISDVAVKAWMEANRKDSIVGVPGQIDIMKTSGGFMFGLSPDFILRFLKLEATKPLTK